MSEDMQPSLPGFQLGEAIAERIMEFVPTSGTKVEITVRVGKPVRDRASDRAWVCPLQIQGMGDDDVVGIFGADAMQALLLSIHTIPALLARHAKEAGGTFRYLGRPDASFVDPCRVVLEHLDAAEPANQE